MSSFDRVAHVYDATRSLSPPVMRKVVDGVAEFVGGSSLVDFGVGTGRLAAPLIQRGVDVVGLDIARSMIGQARDKGVARLVLAAGESAPFRGESFDYAMVVHFMHLMEEWKAVVREISRVTRKGLITLVGDPLGSLPRDTYVQLREGRGFKMAGLKMGEREMAEMVKPSVTRVLVEYRERFDPSQLLEEYAAKLHSITWDVPDKVNAEIVDAMRPLLGRKRERERKVIMAVWDRSQLRGFDPSA
ncbi:MAG TPA: class I SAM-dependent methyltransferase [Nitrososphaerales archaeon]|nr:class I SAM-dependent methyltransferase [Nitrososphaerales archaeon]